VFILFDILAEIRISCLTYEEDCERVFLAAFIWWESMCFSADQWFPTIGHGKYLSAQHPDFPGSTPGKIAKKIFHRVDEACHQKVCA
jgi:hypothetical protein